VIEIRAAEAVEVRDNGVDLVAEALAFGEIGRSFGLVPFRTHDLLPQVRELSAGLETSSTTTLGTPSRGKFGLAQGF
jgi:hypothetical protein